MSYITDNEGNKYELFNPGVKGLADVVYDYVVLKPIAPVVEDKPTVELEHIDQQGTAPGTTSTDVIKIESKVWTPAHTTKRYSQHSNHRAMTVPLPDSVEELIHKLFMAGYECGKKDTGLQMVIVSDVVEPATVAAIAKHTQTAITTALQELESKVSAKATEIHIGGNKFIRLTEVKALMQEAIKDK